MTGLTELVLIVLRLQLRDVFLEHKNTIAPGVRQAGLGVSGKGGLQIEDVRCMQGSDPCFPSERSVRGTLTLNRLLWGLVSESGESLEKRCH